MCRQSKAVWGINMEKADKTEMVLEAAEKLELLGISEEEIENFQNRQEIPAVFVNHKEKKLCKFVLEQEQKDIIEKLKKDKDMLVYYVIIDTGLWQDGCVFKRWSFLTLHNDKSEWNMEKEESIVKYSCVMAYVYNCEEPGYAGLCEMPFRNVNGYLVNTQ